jgi:hypothetical protein
MKISPKKDRWLAAKRARELVERERYCLKEKGNISLVVFELAQLCQERRLWQRAA